MVHFFWIICFKYDAAGAGSTEPTLYTDENAPLSPLNNQILNNILKLALNAKKNGQSENTLTTEVRNLKHLARLCNLNNPEEVKTTIANQEWKNGTKRKFIFQYANYAKFLKIEFEKPKYRKDE